MPSDLPSFPVSIACPNCARKLKVEKPELLGKKVKCPKCQTPFVLKLPPPVEEVVELELVDDDPPVGTSPQWIPDNESSAASSAPSSFPDFSAPPETPKPASSPSLIVPTEDSATSSLERLKRRRKKGRGGLIVTAVFLLAAVGVVGYLATIAQKKPAPIANSGAPQNSPGTESVSADEPYSRAMLENRPQIVEEFSPTSGEPIELYLMPSGVNFVVHFRPADLWSDSRDAQILRASLTENVTNWLETTLQELCHRSPSEIEEVVLGYIIGARGTTPDLCAVIHLKSPEKMSTLIDEFKGEYLYDITERPDLRIKVNETQGSLIKDEQTIAILPAHLAGELEYSIDTPNRDISEGMDHLLRETDRDKLFTVVGNVADLRRHTDVLFPPASQQIIQQSLDWLGDDVEMVSWEVNPSPYLHSELMLRVTNTSSPTKVKERLQQQFAALPERLWKDVCLKMAPSEMRFRQFIGRLPAMVEAVRQSTVTNTATRYLTMTTVLPQKAAPNLALATLFTLDEASRTDFTQTVDTQPQTDEPQKSVRERLKNPVDAEFNRMPLEKAFTYLCEEIGVVLEVDGIALENAGFTRNMPQTFNLGIVPAERAMAEIVNTYQEPGRTMAISVDESQNKIILTTKKFADQRGLEIYEFSAN
ncbi:hypothetical protein AB1L42_16350 [Thalassoglobus sp. JC818]|uniref:hypothetical protein n=1 Tax=Thalassoglobus sp. JC818 TaxID=3232136 RepID=UPI003458FBC9